MLQRWISIPRGWHQSWHQGQASDVGYFSLPDAQPTLAPEAIFKLLLSESSQAQDDCSRLFDALVFNALIGGTDAHGWQSA